MNRIASRKNREKHLLDRFLTVAGLEVQSVEQSEAPDFLLQVQSKLIGIEVTEVFRNPDLSGRSPRALESITDRIVARARSLYHVRNCRFVHVNVLFFDGVDVQSLNREQVADRIATLVESMSLESAHVHWRNDYEDPSLDAVAFVTALAVPEASMSHWGVPRAGWRTKLSTELLRSAIEAKNEKVQAYRAKADEVWLLLAVEGSRPSQFFDPEVPPATSDLASRFDRTYWFNSMHDQVVCWRGSDA
ncbi:hypothetical protein [Hydrogenophaga luteola]|uniref:Uncharacterized protein n=1 Tax=Hydrogenophaga luteola TaxID=1591122 RepID=A0ABV7W4W1_9BURK